MTYLDHARRPFDPAVFRTPPSDCRGAPFWSWNGALDRDRLFRQLEAFKRMGLGGAHLHVRTGLSSPDYLSDGYLDLARSCVDEAERLGLIAWLYDEDRWPSGFAGGLVTQDPALRCRHLRITRTPCTPGESRTAPVHHSEPLPVTERTPVAAWALRFGADGLVDAVRRLGADEAPAAGETGLWAYQEVCPTSTWFNHQTYLDNLNPAAVDRFLAVTHERYAQALGDRLGRTAPAIFTDEPLIRNNERPKAWNATADTFLTWTGDLAESYRQAWGEDLLDVLPGVLFDRRDGGSARNRWRFQDHLSERFASAFADRVGGWCERHGIMSTGHMMGEEGLFSQSFWTGEAMRHYRGFQLPGIDMLCDRIELTTAKQAQSAARQYGRPGVMSELYGVTNWDFDFQGHKRQGDWQAALGITLRVQHLAWYSMAGEAKRDYPAAIGPQSPWYEAYPVVEDHFARLNTVLTRGAPGVRVAVVHPVESFWTEMGPHEAHADAKRAMDDGFHDLAAWLLHGLVDFDYLCEALLPEQAPVQRQDRLQVGRMAYEVVVVPHLATIRSTTLDRLEAFAAGGGTVVFAGRIPALVDGMPSDRPRRLAAGCRQVALERAALLDALAPWRELDVRDRDGSRPAGLLHQLRIEADGTRWLFVCCTDRERGPGAVRLRLRGAWSAQALGTGDGSMAAAATAQAAGWTELAAELPAAGHVLLRLAPAAAASGGSLPAPRRWREAARLAAPLAVERAEPNVLLLDRGAWRLDDGPWQPEEELLRADNIARAAAGMPERHGNIAQPWCEPPARTAHTVSVAFTIDCAVPVRAPRLALERAAQAVLRLDGAPLPTAIAGWWVDEDIPTVALPDLAAGSHRLEVTLPMGSVDGLEWCHLLGDFGVVAAGRHARITAEPTTWAFGDWTAQGLPFYGGNLRVRCRFTAPGGPLRLAIPGFKAPAVGVELDGRHLGHVAYAPWRLDLGSPAAGVHELVLTVYGNRMNTFGQLHNANRDFVWWGPNSWRTTGDEWSDEYLLRPMGLLIAPQLEVPA